MNRNLLWFCIIILIISLVLFSGCLQSPQSKSPTSSTQIVSQTPTTISTAIPTTVIPTTISPTIVITSLPQNQENRNIATVKKIVENYHNTHTYDASGMYVCAQMAQDVWDMVKTQGIAAKIEVGNVNEKISKIQDANHAWVLAEVSPNTWVAMETTGGYLVCNDATICPVTNSLYYTGWSFNTPKELQDYLKNGVCSEGYVLGKDNLCHLACGVNTYCTGNSVCINGECKGCSSGYVLGQDYRCYPACPEGSNNYCSRGVCRNGNCYAY
jgi:hypothetical protein